MLLKEIYSESYETDRYSDWIRTFKRLYPQGQIHGDRKESVGEDEYHEVVAEWWADNLEDGYGNGHVNLPRKPKPYDNTNADAPVDWPRNKNPLKR